MPKSNNISVIIPAYNSERTIEKCLRALHAQTLPPSEIIVVDDGSTDNTVTIARKWALVIQNSRHKGSAGARNSGAAVAGGDILAFTDSDCIPPPDWLKNIDSALSDPMVGAVGGGYCSGVGKGFWQEFCHAELVFRRRNRKERVNTLVSNNMACRRSTFREAEGFPEAYPVCEDMLLSYRISQRHPIIWLKQNGVRHHFVNSLPRFLAHQFRFGAESTKFFLQNPELLFAGNHQGRSLHQAIGIIFFALISGIIALIFMISNVNWLSVVFAVLFLLFLGGHLLLYLNFIYYLKQKGFKPVAKAYGVSLLRDAVCGLSLLEGLKISLNEKITARRSEEGKKAIF